MTLDELRKAIAAQSGVSASDVDAVLTGLKTVVCEKIGEGDITIPGLVKLSPDVRAARKGRNPKTGEEIQIAEKKIVKAKVVKPLSDILAE